MVKSKAVPEGRSFSDGAIALRRKLPHHALATAAVLRRAIQIAAGIDVQVTNRILAIATTSEVVKIGVSPAAAGRTQFENIAIRMDA